MLRSNINRLKTTKRNQTVSLVGVFTKKKIWGKRWEHVKILWHLTVTARKSYNVIECLILNTYKFIQMLQAFIWHSIHVHILQWEYNFITITSTSIDNVSAVVSIALCNKCVVCNQFLPCHHWKLFSICKKHYKDTDGRQISYCNFRRKRLHTILHPTCTILKL